MLKTESHDAPLLRIIGHPVQISANEWQYTVKLQDGNPSSFIDATYFEAGRRVIDGGTSTSDELNYKYGGDYFANVFELQSHIGYLGRKVEVTDKFIRLEMGGKSAGLSYGISGRGGSYSDGNAIGVGYVYQPCLLYTSPSPRDRTRSRMPSSA